MADSVSTVLDISKVNAAFDGSNLRSVAAASALSPRAVMRAVLAAEKERSQLLSLAESGAVLSQSQLERLRQLQEAALPQDSRPSSLPASAAPSMQKRSAS